MPNSPHVVAIIDDDDIFREALHALLTTFDCEVEVYDSADAFLAAAATSKAHCLMIDIHLGRASGIELGRKLVRDGCRLPIIYMTGSDNKSIQQQALDAGCVAFLSKPFVAPALAEALAAAQRDRCRR